VKAGLGSGYKDQAIIYFPFTQLQLVLFLLYSVSAVDVHHNPEQVTVNFLPGTELYVLELNL
jgi:hypothetical protein